MDEGAARYAIRGGEAGYQRLLMLSRERRADTAALLDRQGVRPGMRCVDVGCGAGEVTFEPARRVGPSGHVVGLDMDAVKLELAAQAARERGVANVEFRRTLVQEWEERDVYDVGFSRFLLQHLPDPSTMLRTM